MPFALTPDEGPPRILRFAELSNDLLAILNKETNVLFVDREKWARLSELDRHMVERTHAPFVFDTTHPRKESVNVDELERCED